MIAIESGDVIANRPISGELIPLYKLLSYQGLAECSLKQFMYSFVLNPRDDLIRSFNEPDFILDLNIVRKRSSRKRLSLMPIFKPGTF